MTTCFARAPTGPGFRPRHAGRRVDGRSGRDRPRYRAGELATALAARLPPFVLYGDPDVLAERARALGLAVPIAAIANLARRRRRLRTLCRSGRVPIGAGGRRCGHRRGDRGGDGGRGRGEALALVTNPIAKRTLDLAQLAYPGHTEFLAELAVRHGAGRRPRPVMMLAAEELKVVPATVHIPLSAVPARSRAR